MATNIIYDRIITGIKKAWSVKMPIVAGDDKTRAPEWLNVNLNNITKDALPGGAKIFSYTFWVDYYASDQKTERFMQEISDIMDAMGDNSSYISGGVEYYYNGEVLSASFEDEDVDYKCRLEWSCDYMEIG